MRAETKTELLRRAFGHESFREGQETLIDALLSGRDAFGVMPTGAGKSVCYQLPALMMDGVTLVVSPLISLMKDQVAALKAAGVPAAYINSSLTPGQQALALRRAAAGAYRVIYVAPERLDSPGFLAFAREARVSLVAVDEAHCVSQWGQDFRPSYLRIADFIDSLPNRPPVGAFTATATARVRADVIERLRLRDPVCVTTGFDRPNLRFEVRTSKRKHDDLLELIERHPNEAGIVYCATRKNVEEVCEKLRGDGYLATRYHAGLSDEERRSNQDDFRYDRSLVMVATNAFGMGIDKANVAYVCHYNMPKNLESYYQEAGRAGRDGSPAECVLLFSPGDVFTARWLIEHAEDNPDLTDEERMAFKAREYVRLRQMEAYCDADRCLRGYILNYFGEKAPDNCANCSVCAGFLSAPKRRRAASAGDGLYERLRALRGRIAAERKTPAYIIFNDATLRDMADRKPKNAAELARVSGVGEYKLKLYGSSFLMEIRAFLNLPLSDGVGLDGAPITKPATKRPDADSLEAFYRPWDDEEDARLRSEHSPNPDYRELAQKHGRSPGAIRARLRLLGLEK